MGKNSAVLFETDASLVGEFFNEATSDLTRALNTHVPFRNEVDGRLYFRQDWLLEFLRGRNKTYLIANKIIERIKSCGFIHDRLDSVDENEVPPINDWGAIRAVTLIHEETEGTRVFYHTEQAAEKKMEKLRKLYPTDEQGKIDFKMVKTRHHRLIPTEEDYATRTTKVIILGAELTAEPAPPVTGDTSRWVVKGRQPNYNAYAEAVLTCAPDESVIYPIHVYPSANYQQTYLRAAVHRIDATAQVRMERYGDDYIRLRRK